MVFSVKKFRLLTWGFLLDCMNSSNPKLGDADEDYWKHTNLCVHWDAGCRIRHQQPTWYFSFLGRRQKMVEWVDRSHNYNSRGCGQGYEQGGGDIGKGTASVAAASGEEVGEGVQGLNLQG